MFKHYVTKSFTYKLSSPAHFPFQFATISVERNNIQRKKISEQTSNHVGLFMTQHQDFLSNFPEVNTYISPFIIQRRPPYLSTEYIVKKHDDLGTESPIK